FDMSYGPSVAEWERLRDNIKQHGTANSLMIALMPTASSSILADVTPCFEPINQNVYREEIANGHFVSVNRYLVLDLIERGLWTPEVRDQLLANKGSLRGIDSIPDDLKKLYRTVWEINPKTLIDIQGIRTAFVDQSS